MKKVSVVMCTYNGELFLKEQLDSILNQTYPIYEIIIQDDCSTDNTPLIIEEYSKKTPLIISYRNEKQQGINKNFYSAISKAKGEYIAISDQDDIWDIHKIEKQISCIKNNLLCFCFSKPFVEGETSIAFDERIQNCFAERMIFISVVPGHTILMHTDLVEKISALTSFDCFLYDATFQIVAALEGKITFFPEVLVYHRRHINAATYTIPLDYSKTFTNMMRSLWRTIKLYIEIRPKVRSLFSERYRFLKAAPVEASKKQEAELITFYMQEKGILNYLKLTFLCVKHRDRIFYTKEKNDLLSILRGLYFPISCFDYFRYLSSK